jgi:hypothetical protein
MQRPPGILSPVIGEYDCPKCEQTRHHNEGLAVRVFDEIGEKVPIDPAEASFLPSIAEELQLVNLEIRAGSDAPTRYASWSRFWFKRTASPQVFPMHCAHTPTSCGLDAARKKKSATVKSASSWCSQFFPDPPFDDGRRGRCGLLFYCRQV